jgi:hypothetical protein
VKLSGAIRVYPVTAEDGRVDVVCVAAEDQKLRCHHLEPMDERLVWVPRPEGSLMIPISLHDFVAWLDQGGLGIRPVGNDEQAQVPQQGGTGVHD